MKKKNDWIWIALIAFVLLSGTSLRTIFRLGIKVLSVGATVILALVIVAIIAALVLLLVKLFKPTAKKEDEPPQSGTNVYTTKSADGQKTAYVRTDPNPRKTVNPYSSHATSRPAPPEPKPEPEPVKKPEPKSTGNKELDLVLKQGRGYIAKMEELNGQIPDFKVSARIKQVEILTEKIFSYVETHPEDIHQTRQLLSYYLPTTVKLLERYIELQNQGIRMGNIDEGMQKVEDLLDKLAVAFQQQLDGLFADDLVDITADIQVMEQMLASEGLTGTKDF